MAIEYRGEEILFVVEIENATGSARLLRPFNQTSGSKEITADTIDLDTKDKMGSDYGKVSESLSLEGILTEGDGTVGVFVNALREKRLVKIYEVNTRTNEAESGMYMISSFNREYSNGDFATYSLEATLNGSVARQTLEMVPGGAGYDESLDTLVKQYTALMERVATLEAGGGSPITVDGDNLVIPYRKRLHLATDAQWIAGQGHLSDLIRLQWIPRADGAGSKPAIVWCDENMDDKTAIISHDLANDKTRAPHRHLSIETTMSPTGANPNELFTRIEFPYDQDVCEIQVHSSNFTLNGNKMRVANEDGGNKEIVFSRSYSKEANLDEKRNPIYSQVYVPRMALRVGGANSTGNAGDDFQIVRYDDKGSALDTVFFIKRSSGNTGIGTNAPTKKLDINGDRMRLRTAFTPANATATGDPGEIAWDANYMYVCVAANTWKRSPLATW